MGTTNCKDALRGDFDTRMAANASTTLIQWDNREKPHFGGNTTPQDPPDLSTATAPWVTYTIRTAGNFNVSPGFRDDVGSVVVQVFGAPNKGPAPVEDLAETVRAQFVRRTVSQSRSFNTPVKRPQPRSTGIQLLHCSDTSHRARCRSL